MLLQRLVEYSRRLDLPPALYAETPVRYVIDLERDGTPTGMTDTADPSFRETRRGVKRFTPSVKRSSGIKPLLLADNAEYTLGLARDETKAGRVDDAHAAYVQLVEACRIATNSPEVAAVVQFMGRIPELLLPADFDRAGLVTFRVDGTFVVDQPAVQAFWASENAPADSLQMQCLICGQRRPVLERLQANIKGGLIPGGQTSGTSMISANAAAFESYGLTASLTAPTCTDCGERFTKALNHLLSAEHSHIRFADSVYVFWTRESEPAWDPFTLLDRAEAEDVRVLMETVRSGTPGAVADPNRFYAVVLSAAGGRAVVREWIDVTLPDAREALRRWFAAHAILDLNTGARRHFSIKALAGATAREFKDISPATTRALLHSAFTGTPVPAGLLTAVVLRSHAERRVTAAHASVIRLVLGARAGNAEEEDTMVALQADHPSAGYQCGRLLAVLEAIQRAALPNVKAGIIDRYFGSASASPARILPRLAQGAQPHLGVLQRERPAAHAALQRRLEEVLAQLPAFPRILKLEDQGLFLLGYYHQRADDRARARGASERLRAGAAVAGDEGEAEAGDEGPAD